MKTHAANDPAHLIVGGREVPFVVSPFVGEDYYVYAPVDFVRLLGADYKMDGDTATITGSDGKVIKQKCRIVQSRPVVPVQTVAGSLGADVTWDDSRKTLSLLARLLMARVDNGSFTIATSYPVYYETNVCEDPPRVFVDIHGAELNASAATIPASGDDVTHIRSGQLDQNTIRLVLDLRHPINYQSPRRCRRALIKLSLNTPRTMTAFVPVIGKRDRSRSESWR